MKKILVLFILLVNSTLCVIAQTKSDTTAKPMISPFYAFQVPFGDLKQEYGINSLVGLDFSVITKKQFVYRISGGYIFGDDVKDSMLLGNLKTSEGYILSNDGFPAEIILNERGFSGNISVGKVLPILSVNPGSGLMVTVGAGAIAHKIKVKVLYNNVPSLTDDYVKGYDRLTSGFTLNQFVGYMFLSKSRFVNFYIGVDATEGFTQNRRSWDFSTGQKIDGKRVDVQVGLKFGWNILLYNRHDNRFQYY